MADPVVDGHPGAPSEGVPATAVARSGGPGTAMVKLLQDLVGADLSGRYRLEARIAGGGMGDVYCGYDLLLGRTVAVKILQASLTRDDHVVDGFLDEARAAARLAHANVVAVYDWGSDDDATYYMVMEYVAGTDARDLLVAHGPLEPAQAAEVMAFVCDALSAAHARGLVHRDVKPENVLVSHEGVVKVADFGIAAIADADRTLPGRHVAGTLRYLSPEQARGRIATHASDVWAAGAVLSELLTGRPPLQGAGPDLLRRRSHESPVPPSDFDVSIPADLDAIVLTACALDPADRFLDASDMAIALRRAAARSLPDAPPLSELVVEVTGELRIPDMMPVRSTSAGERKHKPRRKRTSTTRRIVRGLATTAVMVVLSLSGLHAAGLVGARHVTVPSVVGLSKERAAHRAGAAGLEVEVGARREHRRVPRGRILSQSPRGGEVEAGTTVRVVVSDGPPVVVVPLVVGLDVTAARTRIETRGLRVGSIERRPSAHPADRVVDQEPPGGSLPWGARVNVVASTGTPPERGRAGAAGPGGAGGL